MLAINLVSIYFYMDRGGHYLAFDPVTDLGIDKR